MDNASKKLSVKGKCFFFDIKEARNGSKYLQITETRKGANGERVRNSLTLFQDNFKDFLLAVNEMCQML